MIQHVALVICISAIDNLKILVIYRLKKRTPCQQKNSDHFHFLSWLFIKINDISDKNMAIKKHESRKKEMECSNFKIKKSKTKIRLCTQYKKSFALKTTKLFNSLKYKLIQSFSDNNSSISM